MPGNPQGVVIAPCYGLPITTAQRALKELTGQPVEKASMCGMQFITIARRMPGVKARMIIMTSGDGGRLRRFDNELFNMDKTMMLFGNGNKIVRHTKNAAQHEHASHSH
jgi:NAD/NADP transhydrogenase beta subunit